MMRVSVATGSDITHRASGAMRTDDASSTMHRTHISQSLAGAMDRFFFFFSVVTLFEIRNAKSKSVTEVDWTALGLSRGAIRNFTRSLAS